MTDTQAILSDLLRVKASLQARGIATVIGIPSTKQAQPSRNSSDNHSQALGNRTGEFIHDGEGR